MAITVNFTFPPDDLVCDDHELLSHVIKVVHIGSTMISSWFSGIFHIHLRWRVRNQQPYVESIRGELSHYEGLYYISVDPSNMKYEVKSDDKVVEDSRSILLEWLNLASDESILYDVVSTPFRVELQVVKPHTLKIPRIGESLEALWDLIWYQFKGDIPGYSLTWIINREGLFNLTCMKNEGFKLTFSSRHPLYAEVIIDCKRSTFRDTYNVNIASDYVNAINMLSKIVKDLKTMITVNNLNDKWCMDTEVYSEYIQWLPREMLNDVEELV